MYICMFVTIKFFFFLSVGKSVSFDVIENNSIDISARVPSRFERRRNEKKIRKSNNKCYVVCHSMR